MTGINVLLEALERISVLPCSGCGDETCPPFIASRALAAWREGPGLAGDERAIRIVEEALKVTVHAGHGAYAIGVLRALDELLRGEPSPPDGTGRGGR